MYYLVNSGTRDEPWGGDLHRRYAAWNAEHGDVQMFPWRPREMGPGDVLVHRAVGSPHDELIAIGEVLSRPEPSGHNRWPWQVRRRLVHVCRELESAPSCNRIGVNARGLRVMKRLDVAAGARAVELIAAAATPPQR